MALLCDGINEFASRPDPQSGDWVKARIIAQELAQSEKFILQETAVECLEYVSTRKPSTILAARKMLQLPYNKMWVEWLHDDRVRHSLGENAGLLRDGQTPVRRMGFLFLSDDGVSGKIHIGLEFHNTGQIMIMDGSILFDFRGGVSLPNMVEHSDESMALLRSIHGKNFNEEKELQSWRELGKLAVGTANGLISRSDMDRSMGAENAYRYLDLAGKEAAEESGFALAVLIAINSKSVLRVTGEADDVSLRKINKKRNEKKRPALFAHKVLDLNISKVMKNRAISA